MKTSPPPCKNCITLAVCKGRIKELNEKYKRAGHIDLNNIICNCIRDDNFLKEFLDILNDKCSLIYNYIPYRRDANIPLPKDEDECFWMSKVEEVEDVFREVFPTLK